eukprot:Nk52_evm42s2367 gene=Nk52_evmTU42s2367
MTKSIGSMTMKEQEIQVDIVINEIVRLLDSSGEAGYIGEAITQKEHMLQAAHFAYHEGYDHDVVIAALLHDIGHLCAPPDGDRMGDFGVADHESIGALYLLRRGFSQKVADLVYAHVYVKRYLTKREAGYHESLSPASAKSLEYQGGPLTDQEADDFEKQPFFEEKLRMRYWDEMSKVAPHPKDFEGLQFYIPIMKKHLLSQVPTSRKQGLQSAIHVC